MTLNESTTEYTETIIKINVSDGRSITGILTEPSTPYNLLSTPTPPIALIAHGFAGHKDYIYQRLLARSLPLISFRFDFTSCGDSQVDGSYNRDFVSDHQDLSAISAYFENTHTITHIIGHSRGSLAMLLWAASKAPLTIRYIINCASRFRPKMVLTSFEERYPNFEANGGTIVPNVRVANGQYKEMWVSYSETKQISEVDIPSMLLSIIDRYKGKAKMLSIYGSKDHVVPIEDAYMYEQFFENYSNQLPHRLVIVPEADHNYYGPPRNENEKRANYNPLVVSAILEFINPTLASARNTRI